MPTRTTSHDQTALGERVGKVELNILVQRVVVTGDRRGALEEFRQYAPALTDEQLAEVPTLLVGTAGQIAEQLRANRERFGLNYVTVLEHDLETFAPVSELLR